MTAWAIAIAVLILIFVVAVAWATPHAGRRRVRRERGAAAEILFFNQYAPRSERQPQSKGPVT
jgi:hypothetical protein